MSNNSILQFINSSINLKESIHSIKGLTNSKLLYEILLNCDYSYFYSKLNLTFDQSFGILFTELSETISTISNYLNKSGLNFRVDYENLKDINIGRLLSDDLLEISKLADLIILLMLNCSNKSKLISHLEEMDENTQRELLILVEKYINLSVSPKSSPEKSPRATSLILAYEQKIEKYEIDIKELKSKLTKQMKENLNLKNMIEIHEETIKELELNKVDLSLNLKYLKEEIAKLNKIKPNYERSDSVVSNNTVKFTIVIDNLNNEIVKLNNQIKTLEAKNSNLDKIKDIYESNKSKIDIFDSMKDKVAYYENFIKNMNKQEAYESVSKLEKELKSKDVLISQLKEKIDKAEKQNKITFTDKLDEENESIRSIPVENVNTNKSNDILFNKFSSAKKKNFIEQIDLKFDVLSKEELMKEEKDFVIDKYISLSQAFVESVNEIEYTKKEISDIKIKYDTEFEIMSSCVYNLGVQFIITKQEFANKMRENPPWLVKERQRFFNGDI